MEGEVHVKSDALVLPPVRSGLQWQREVESSVCRWVRHEWSLSACNPFVLFCQSCKRGKSRIQQRAEACQSYSSARARPFTGAQTWTSCTQPLFVFKWRILLLSPQLLVTAHCVLLKRPIILEFITSVDVLDKQVSIATADETSTYYEAASCLQHLPFNPIWFLRTKEQEILKHTRLE